MEERSRKVKPFDTLTKKQQLITMLVLILLVTIGIGLVVVCGVLVIPEHMMFILIIGSISVTIVAYLTTDYLIKVFVGR